MQPSKGRQRGTTVSFHFFLSFASFFFASFQVFPKFFSSVCSPLRQVFFGLPCFRCLWGFHSSACFVIFVSFYLRVCSSHLHFLVFVVCVIGCCCVLLHSSLIEMVLRMLRMFLKHLDAFAGSYCFSPGLRTKVMIIKMWSILSGLRNSGKLISCLL